MSASWEYYVEQAAEASWNSVLPTYWLDEDSQAWSAVPEWKDAKEEDREYAVKCMRAALAEVGPLIEAAARV